MINVVTVRIPSYTYKFYQQAGAMLNMSAESAMGEVLFEFAEMVYNEVIKENPEASS